MLRTVVMLGSLLRGQREREEKSQAGVPLGLGI